MNVGVLGSGDVAKVLAGGLLKHGHEVMMGTRESAKLADWGHQNPKARIGSFAEAAKFGELLVLAVKGSAAAEALRAAGAHTLAGKTVIDATDPIADAPPTNGVLSFFTRLDESLMERLQREFPEVRFVKALNSVGNACIVNPQFAGGRPTMFICGNDEAAKQSVARILDQFGWETEEHGPGRGGACHRAAVHALVHPGLLAQPMDPRLQAPQVALNQTEEPYLQAVTDLAGRRTVQNAAHGERAAAREARLLFDKLAR
jgi:predicted dinucleotide-binding enzyme